MDESAASFVRKKLRKFPRRNALARNVLIQRVTVGQISVGITHASDIRPAILEVGINAPQVN